MERHRDRVVGNVARAMAVSLMVLGFGACSSSDSGAVTANDSTTVAASSTPTSPAVGTSSTVGPATTPASTSTAPSATPATSSLPTSTEPPDDPETAVQAALEQGFADFSACLVAMPNCDQTTLEMTRAGDLLQGNVERINEWNAAGYTVRDRDQYRYVIESVDLDPALDRAMVTVCFADGSKLVLPNAGPDGADVIVDGAFVSARESWDVRLDPDGNWRAYDAPLVGETSEADQCGA